MDNFLSYRRFTSVSPNISEYGATVEELAAVSGKPNANPVASPMPDTAVADVRLALANIGSDKGRIGELSRPASNPFEGPKRTLVLSRNAVTKMRGKVVLRLHQLVKAGAVGNAEVQPLMDDSLNRIQAMANSINYLNGLADQVMVHAASVAKP